jgi:hypothetical protein
MRFSDYMKLYKYHSLNENSISCLVNSYVWFSSPSDFNDPFDTKIVDNSLLQDLSFTKEKIFCLSAINNNLLMWSHYSDCHKGFCIEYSEYSDEELKKKKSKGIYPSDASIDRFATIRNAKKVVYKNSNEIEEYISEIPHDKNEFLSYYHSLKTEVEQKKIVDKIQSTTFIKHEDWSYEEEWRIINTQQHMMHPPGKITAVYFGMNMPSIHKRTIGMLVNPNLNDSCKLFQMYRSPGKYSLEAKQFNLRKDLDGIEVTY